MATIFLEPGGDATFDAVSLWPGTPNGTPQIVSDIVHGSHVRCLQFRANTNDQVIHPTALADAGRRLSFWIYIDALGTATSYPLLCNNSGNTASPIELAITTGGALQLQDNNNTQIGSNGATLSTGQWYQICLSYVITSTTVNDIRLFVNNSLSITVHNVTLPAVSTAQVFLGNGSSDTTFKFRASDIYIDNSTSLTDVGVVWVTAKRPNANGTTNGFTTQIGAGGSGYGSGHSPQVNERPLNTANGWSIASAGSAITEEYNIESVSQGDIDITGATIVDYMGWVSAKALVSETASIIVNNITSNISLVNTIGTFEKIAGSSTYPAGTGKDIGIITSTTVTTVSLYECGIIVAYIPAVATATPQGGYMPTEGFFG